MKCLILQLELNEVNCLIPTTIQTTIDLTVRSLYNHCLGMGYLMNK